MIWGTLLIAGAMVDQAVMPNMLSSVNDITNSIEGNVMSGLPVDIQTSQSFAIASTVMNSEFDHMQLQLSSLEKYMQLGSISMGIIGIGIVAFGGLAKNTKLKTSDSSIEILKKKLAKGEITKMEFDNLKQDVQ